MCLAEASVRKRNGLAAGADQRRAEPKVSLPPPISGLMPAKPGQDVVGANARDHVGLAFGVAGAIDRGPDGQCQVLDVTDRVKGPRRVPRRCRRELGRNVDGGRYRGPHRGYRAGRRPWCPDPRAVERVITNAARSASLPTAPLQVMMRPWSGRDVGCRRLSARGRRRRQPHRRAASKQGRKKQERQCRAQAGEGPTRCFDSLAQEGLSCRTTH
jgi:hypothetical protein